MRAYHPDKLSKLTSILDKAMKEAEAKEITNANDTLSDPEKRRQYDDQLRAKMKPAQAADAPPQHSASEQTESATREEKESDLRSKLPSEYQPFYVINETRYKSGDAEIDKYDNNMFIKTFFENQEAEYGRSSPFFIQSGNQPNTINLVIRGEETRKRHMGLFADEEGDYQPQRAYPTIIHLSYDSTQKEFVSQHGHTLTDHIKAIEAQQPRPHRYGM